MTRLSLVSFMCLVFAVAGLAADGASAQTSRSKTQAPTEEIACGTTYTTQAGDYLARIAQRAYGHASAYHVLYQYNPGKLGSPSQLDVGVDLWIPCLGEGGRPDALPPVQESTSDDIKIVTGADYPPYVDAGLPGGGFSFELVERALQRGGGAADYRIDVIKDWGSYRRSHSPFYQ